MCSALAEACFCQEALVPGVAAAEMLQQPIRLHQDAASGLSGCLTNIDANAPRLLGLGCLVGRKLYHYNRRIMPCF
jgi:hypothetical protein